MVGRGTVDDIAAPEPNTFWEKIEGKKKKKKEKNKNQEYEYEWGMLRAETEPQKN